MRALRRLSENADIVPETDSLKHQQPHLPQGPSASPRPSPLLRRAPCPGALGPLFLRHQAPARLRSLRAHASPALPRPSGPRLGRGSPERQGGDASRRRGRWSRLRRPRRSRSPAHPPSSRRRRPPARARPAQQPPRPPRQARSLVGEAPPRGPGPREPAGRARRTPLGLRRPRLPRPARRGAGNAAASALVTFNSNCHRRRLPSPRARRRRRAPGPPSPPPHLPGRPPSLRLGAFPQPGPAAAEAPRVRSRPPESRRPEAETHPWRCCGRSSPQQQRISH